MGLVGGRDLLRAGFGLGGPGRARRQRLDRGLEAPQLAAEIPQIPQATARAVGSPRPPVRVAGAPQGLPERLAAGLRLPGLLQPGESQGTVGAGTRALLDRLLELAD